MNMFPIQPIILFKIEISPTLGPSEVNSLMMDLGQLVNELHLVNDLKVLNAMQGSVLAQSSYIIFSGLFNGEAVYRPVEERWQENKAGQPPKGFEQYIKSVRVYENKQG